jgi:hypothetical protein
MSDGHPDIPPSSEELSRLWDEYKYRHALCWSAAYKVVAAVLALEVLPYAKDDLTERLDYVMLLPPTIGVFVGIFGSAVVMNELRVFTTIKTHFREREKLLPSHPSRESTDKRSHFDRYVRTLLGTMLVLAIANLVFLAVFWIPELAREGRYCDDVFQAQDYSPLGSEMVSVAEVDVLTNCRRPLG